MAPMERAAVTYAGSRAPQVMGLALRQTALGTTDRLCTPLDLGAMQDAQAGCSVSGSGEEQGPSGSRSSLTDGPARDGSGFDGWCGWGVAPVIGGGGRRRAGAEGAAAVAAMAARLSRARVADALCMALLLALVGVLLAGAAVSDWRRWRSAGEGLVAAPARWRQLAISCGFLCTSHCLVSILGAVAPALAWKVGERFVCVWDWQLK
jgi:hypothetical protein